MEKNKLNALKGILSHALENKRIVSQSIVFAIISVMAGVSIYFFVSLIIIDFTQGQMDLSEIILPITLMIIASFLKGLCYKRSSLKSHQFAYATLRNIRIKLIEKAAKLPMGEILKNPSGKYKNFIVDEVEKLEYPLAHAIPEVLSNILAPTVIFAYLLTIDIRVALASLAPLVIGFFIVRKMLSNYSEQYSRFIKSGENMNSNLVEYINGIEVVKAFNQTTSSFEKFKVSVESFRDYTLDWYKRSWLYSSIYYAIMPATVAVVLPTAGYLFYLNQLSMNELILSIVLSYGLMPPIIKLTEFTDHIAAIISCQNAVDEFMSLEELSIYKQDFVIKDSSMAFVDVSFAYENVDIIKQMSFKIEANETTAFVGPSGSGKSTIMKLMARFWDVREGKVLIGGVDIKKMPLEKLMENISIVSQDNHLFDMSIMDNIRVGKPDASNEAVYEAAKSAGCHDFIVNNLIEGYETIVGDAGDRLSGGEKQRICIARAILKDAPIILLDEATASIDPENEYKIQLALSELTRNKTLMVVAHRLSTIVDSDKIIVVNDGRIHGSGTHDELLLESKLYQSMWQAHVNAGEWHIRGEAQR